MKRVLMAVLLVLGVLLAPTGARAATGSHADTPIRQATSRVFPPTSHPFGMTYAEWSAAWWQWVLSIPTGKNPLFTKGDVNCGALQSRHAKAGHVWFLVGVINVSGKATRSCTVPTGTALFFPVLNVECDTLTEPTVGASDAQLRRCVQMEVFRIGAVHATIDGVAVHNLRQRFTFVSAPFEFTVPGNNILGVPAATGRAVSRGVWLFLKPLPIGKHTIRFGGTFPNAHFTLDITYHLRVVPRGQF